MVEPPAAGASLRLQPGALTLSGAGGIGGKGDKPLNRLDEAERFSGGPIPTVG